MNNPNDHGFSKASPTGNHIADPLPREQEKWLEERMKDYDQELDFEEDKSNE